MPEDDGFTLVERIEQTNHVTYKVEERKLVYGLGALSLTVTAHIRSDGMKACLGQCGELMAPRIPGFGKSVAHDHEPAAARLGNVHFNAVCTDGTMSKLHALLLEAAVLLL